MANDFIEIKETSISYRLGQIDARLDAHEKVHQEILRQLGEVKAKLEEIKACVNKKSDELAEIRGRSAVYGGVFGFLMSLVVALANWIFKLAYGK